MVASTVGTGLLALPGAASAATLVSGDLIKASGPAVYYYGSDAKRYVFPNETTFFSWFMDFSSVKTISDAELAAIQIGGNMTIRPGTKLVKITTDPKVYAVTKCGTLHWVESESVAVSLYGSDWARRVVDVPDAFFVNYSIGSSIPSAVHPNGSLVSYASAPSDVFVVWNGAKRKLTGSAMSANMYNPANVITTTISYPAGADVTGREADLSDAVCLASTPAQSGTVTVSLASDTPAGATLPKGSSGSMLAKFNLVGGSSAVTINGLRVHRVGVGSTSDFSNVYLYDANGTRLTTGRTINSTSNTVEFNGLNLAVGAGQTVPVVIVGDVACSGTNCASTTSGGQHAFEIMDAASVVMPTTTGMTISGSFPVRANTFVIGTSAAARLDVQKGSTPADANVGSTQVEVSNFKLIANTNDIEVRRVTLFQGGDISNSDLRNFNLYQGSTLVASAASITGNGQIVLNFTPPYVIPSGNTRVFSLKADVSGRSGRAIKTYVEYSTDIYAVDKTYGSGALVCINTSAAGCSSSGATFDGTSSNFITLNTRGGQFTVAFNGPATQNVAKGQNGVVLYRFALTSQSSQLEVRNLYVVVGSTDGGQVCNGTAATTCDEDFVKNVRIRDVATGATVQGPTSPTGGAITGTGATSTITFSNSIYLNAGQTRNFEVVADLSSTSDTDFVDHSFVVKLNTFNTNDIRVVDTGEYLTPSSSVVPNAVITGNVMTVKASSLTVGLASSPSSMTVVKKQTLVPSLGMSFQAGAQSNVLVTAVKVTGQASFTTSISAAAASQLATTVNSCALYEGDTVRSDSKTPDSSGVMNFTNLNWRVERGANKTLVVKCTMASVLGGSGSTNKFSLGLVNGSADVTAQDDDSNTVSPTVTTALDANGDNSAPSIVMTVKSAGTVTIASDSMQQSTILVPVPGAWYPVAQFSASAQNEDVRIERLVVTTTGDAASFSAIGIAKDGTLLNSSPLSGGMNSAQDIDLSSAPIMVQKDVSTRFQLWAQLSNLQASSQTTVGTSAPRSGNSFTVGLAAGTVPSSVSSEYDSNYSGNFDVKMVGMGSGERIYASGSSTFGNTFVVRKSKPTVAIATGSSTLSNNNEFPLLTFTVGSDAAGPVSLKKITLSFSKSTTTASSLSLASFKLKRAGEYMDSSQYTIVNESGTDLTSATPWPVGNTSGRIVIKFTNPEVVSGQGIEYSLRANVAGTYAGDSVSVGFVTTGVTTVVTGYLTGDSAATTLSSVALPGPNLNTTTSGSLLATAPGTFVWSDRSDSGQGNATSGDWTDDLYVRRFDTVSYTR